MKIMSPIRKYNGQNWLPSLFNDFFDNDGMSEKQYHTGTKHQTISACYTV